MAARSTGMPGGQAVHDDGERGAVGLAGGQEAQHRSRSVARNIRAKLDGAMVFAVLAFVTVLFHLAFILFVIFGGFLVARGRGSRRSTSPAPPGAPTSRSRIGSARSRRSRTGSGDRAEERHTRATSSSTTCWPIVYPTGLTAGVQRRSGWR